MTEKIKLVSDLDPNLAKPETNRGEEGACWLYTEIGDSNPDCIEGVDDNGCAYAARTGGFKAYSFQPGRTCRNPGHP
jgi:hypothetical protein